MANMRSIQLTFVFLGLISLVSADFLADHKEFFNQLDSSVEQTKAALKEEQIKDINSMVEKVGGFQEDFEFTEPLFNVPSLYIPAAISEFLYSKEHLIDHLETVFNEKLSAAFYKEKFNKNVGKPCELINQIWAPTLDAYYAIDRHEELFKQIKKYNNHDSDLLLVAGFCHNVMKDPEMSAMDALIFFGCTVMNPGNQCYM